jgi:hypothetical protein
MVKISGKNVKKKSIFFFVEDMELFVTPWPPRYNDRLLVYPGVRIHNSRHYFCFLGCAAVRYMVSRLLAFIKKKKMFLPFMQLENKNNGN